ncbi:MAG TPA: flap endonuclease-1 [Candidatus Nanoarchaeia archaeon]|nr:flap endonuclease-1 [Candidatus Nanoarchaeia archaeon]
MGVNLKDLVIKKEISIKELRGKILAVDGYNNLYQYLTTIRSPDGLALTDLKGRVTSHLIGLFNRTTSLMEEGLKLVFVFDGQPPKIKAKTLEKRRQLKQEASLKLTQAEEAGDVEGMRKFYARTTVLTKEMLDHAKEVITALGLPIVQAPSEGEAQVSHMVKKGTAYASVSQDYDNLIFGCPVLIRNLSITGKRKKTGKLGFQTVKPEIIFLDEVLKKLKLNNDQLIVLAILVGTDYNPGGVSGIGPKTALKLLKDQGEDFKSIFKKVEWKKNYPDLDWKEVFDTIKYIPVTDNYNLEWKPIQADKLITLLVKEYNFSEDRVKSKLKKLVEESKKLGQKGLGNYF